MDIRSSKPWMSGTFTGQYCGSSSSGSIRSHSIFQISITRGVITNAISTEDKPQITSTEVLEFHKIEEVYVHESDVHFGEEPAQNWGRLPRMYQVEIYDYQLTPKHYDHEQNIVFGTVTGTIVANIYEGVRSQGVVQSTPPKLFGNRSFGSIITQRISILAIVSMLNYNSLEVLSIFNLHFFTLSFVELPSEDVYLDTDNDGIVDAKDQCPKNPEDYDHFEDADGCPDVDNDGDGVSDLYDKCLNIPGPVENDGCPLPGQDDEQNEKFLDFDNDGIPNYLDKCPQEAETINFYNDQDGCPDTVPDELRDLLGIQDIFFETRTATLKPESIDSLKKAHQKLTENTTIQLKIEGHTDSVGSMKYNQVLSEQRANTVRSWFLEQGLGKKRVKTIGYSYTKPIANNSTEEGRQKNRRVNFTLTAVTPKTEADSNPNENSNSKPTVE